MSKPNSVIEIDLSGNRLGDSWMVLSSIATAAALVPHTAIHCKIPVALRNLAEKTFAERLRIKDDLTKQAWCWSNAGIRGILPGLIHGQRYVLPYPRIVSHIRKLHSLKHRTNLAVLAALDLFGRACLPPWSTLEYYLGFIQLKSVPDFRALTWELFLQQASSDYSLFRKQMIAAALSNNSTRAVDRILVFSSGVSQQSMPAEWAKRHLPGALYCFHRDNAQAQPFLALGLEVTEFDTPEEIVALGRAANWVVATDSFPSHILQIATDRLTLCLTQDLAKRVVSPCFRGAIVEPCARCAPCAGPNPSPLFCLQGFRYCITWGEQKYTDAILESILQK